MPARPLLAPHTPMLGSLPFFFFFLSRSKPALHHIPTGSHGLRSLALICVCLSYSGAPRVDCTGRGHPRSLQFLLLDLRSPCSMSEVWALLNSSLLISGQCLYLSGWLLALASRPPPTGAPWGRRAMCTLSPLQLLGLRPLVFCHLSRGLPADSNVHFGSKLRSF